MTAHASRRAVMALGYDCPCGRPIRLCCITAHPAEDCGCGACRETVMCRCVACFAHPRCCECKRARFAAETVRLVATEEV